MPDGGRQFSIGRDPGCDVVLADDTVAPRHAWLEVIDGGPMIVSAEAASAPIAIVHGGRAREVRKGIVTPGDVLRVGDIEIPVEEILVAVTLKAGNEAVRGDFPEAMGAKKTPFAAAQPKPDERQHGLRRQNTPPPTPPAVAKAPQAPRGPDRPLTRSLLLPCPACGKPTNSLKRHRLYKLLVFIGVAWWAQTAEYTACPPCMRQVILTRTLVNIPTANVTWPILFVIHAFHFAGSFSAGHSRKVLELIKP